MCKLCGYVSDSGWSQIGWSAFSKAKREKKQNGEECWKWEQIQHHALCLDASHENPTTKREECKCRRGHETEIAVFMHADPSAVLPDASELKNIQQMQSTLVPCKQRLPIVKSIRDAIETGPNILMARDGYGALSVELNDEDRRFLRKYMDEAAAKGKRIPYLDPRCRGRVGYMINPADAPAAFGQAMCRVLSGEIIRAVTYYMGGPVLVMSLELLKTMPNAPDQEVHADVRDPSGRVQTCRLVVIVLLSIDRDDPVTTEVFPNSRSPETHARVFEHHEPGIRATLDGNCVLFDACLAHRGLRNPTSEPKLRLCVTFIQERATPEQLRFAETSLNRKSLNLSVEDLGRGGAAAGDQGLRRGAAPLPRGAPGRGRRGRRAGRGG